jgi:hypothetical protein
MLKRMNTIAMGIGAAALLAAGVTVGTQTASYADTVSSDHSSGSSFTRDTHYLRPASESYAPPSIAAGPPCGFAATGSC